MYDFAAAAILRLFFLLIFYIMTKVFSPTETDFLWASGEFIPAQTFVFNNT